MNQTTPSLKRGALFGLLAAALFGMSAPVSKLLLPDLSPLMLAGLLYLGGGLGLSLYRLCLPATSEEAPLRTDDKRLLGWIILSGGILAPALMLWGLARVSAVAGSLLLNAEAPFTMLIAVLFFREHLGRSGKLAALCIVLGGLLLGFTPGELHADVWGALGITAACLCWGLDNNLTQRLSLKDPVLVVQIKTIGAGLCNLLVASMLASHVPTLKILASALLLGSLSYGASILLDMYALRLLGAAREAAFFATAPFMGALVAVPLLGERPGLIELGAALLMVLGVIFLLRERHAHEHTHEAATHEHLHSHDEHHQHPHEPGVSVTEPHSHLHSHEVITHEHPHVSDLHHRHKHA